MNELINRPNVTNMVRNFEVCIAKINQAYMLLEEADALYKNTFGEKGYGIMPNNYQYTEKAIKAHANTGAWKQIYDLMNLSKILSLEESNRIRTAIEKNEIEPLTLENANAVLNTAVQNSTNYFIESMKETFDILTPGKSWRWKEILKTNEANAFAISEKVILSNMVEYFYLRGRSDLHHDKWNIDYRNMEKLMQVDKVFHVLDGKSFIESGYRSPLVDAITSLSTTETSGETDYFKFKCHKNERLHLVLKRMDLVQKINQSVGISTNLKGTINRYH